MLKLLKQFTKKEWLLSCAALIFIILQVWMDLTLPDYMSEITTLVQTEGSAMADILTASGKMLACALLSFGASVCTVICAARIAANFSPNLRSLLFNQVQSFTMADIGKFSTASLITRSTNDVMQVQIVYISQKATLFSGTVKSNVAYGDNGSREFLDEDVVDAVYTAEASEFVEKMVGTYDAHIAQGGSNLSGGQKQRISIARAICRHPEILIFDDSFSALDYKTDRQVRENLNRECKDTTRLIVAQRIGTIRDADKIIVLHDGAIAGMGTHEELMKHCEVYQQIALSQLSKEELA